MLLIQEHKDIARWRKFTRKERAKITAEMELLRDQVKLFREQKKPTTPEEEGLHEMAMKVDHAAEEVEVLVHDHYLKSTQETYCKLHK